ncbi:MAG: SDR family NAD(P)-dependent oxidoreductase [Clostridiales bacterium]|nr:SDR family NAD(P)-dependent oxidoreductase [Clostridiales bacterium]
MQYVLVTGAYGGMGKAAVKTLKQAGYFIFAMDKNIGEAEENVLPIQADVTDINSLQNAFLQVQSITKELFAICHFAGIYMLDSLIEIEEKTFRNAFEVNVFGAFYINKIFLPLLKKGSRILLTTSELAPLQPLPFTGLYAVTKSTLDKYAYSLRMELQLLGIRVSILRPGAVRTDMLNVSTSALDAFCARTKVYSCNAKRFKKIVESVEARHVPPEKIGKKALKVLHAKRPKYVYTLNRNPLLLLLHVLPQRLQTWIIKQVLK